MSYLKQILSKLLNDNNHFNEKIFVGLLSFILIAATMITDLITGYMGKPLIINEFVFNGVLILCLGSLGISSVDKFTNTKNPINNTTTDDVKDEPDEVTKDEPAD